MMKLTFFLLFIPFISISQGNYTTGKVTNENNELLSNVTITVKRTGVSTATNITGNFSMPMVQAGDTLVISCVGYKTTEIAYINEPLLIVLKHMTQLLPEVYINTGYQVLPKERSTGSFSFINKELLNQQVSTDILSRLESVASSLQVDRITPTGKLMIRGLSTFRSSRDPLIIIDNFPYDGDINNINPNDVENISILKDAAAASIWGARAGNGVIIITTKKAGYEQKLRMEVNSSISISQKQDLFYRKQINSPDFIDLEQFLYSKGFYNGTLLSTSRQAVSPVVEILAKQTSGQLSAAEAEAQINILKTKDVRNDLNKYFYSNAVNQQYHLDLRGGSSTNAWLVGIGMDRNLDQLSATYNRFNLKLDNTYKLTKKLELATTAYWTSSQNISGKPSYNNVAPGGQLFPYSQLAGEDGSIISHIRTYRQSYVDTAGGGKLLDWKYYPLEDYKHAVTKNTIADLALNTAIKYDILPWVRAELRYNIQKQNTQKIALYDEESFYTRDLINRFTQLNRTTGAVTYIVPKGAIEDRTNLVETAQNFRGTVNISKTFQQHNIVSLLGTEIRDTRLTEETYRIFGLNTSNLTYSNVDLANTYPLFINGSKSFIPSNNFMGNDDTRYMSFFGNMAYTYMNKYTLSLSGRKDASNIFGVKANDKWSPLWSAGMGYDISKEPFYNLAFLQWLKLRFTYGYGGNVNQRVPAYTTINISGNSPYTQSPYARFDNYANPELRWEKVKTINFGLDYRFTSQRVWGSLEYYTKQSIDLLSVYPVDYTGGTSATLVKNVGRMKSRGVDVELNSVNIRSKIQWTTNLLFSFNEDKITDYYLSSQRALQLLTTSASISGVIGKPAYSLYGYKWMGLDPATGDPQSIYNGNISKDYNAITGTTTLISDLDYKGPVIAPLFGSLGNTFSYRKFSATARFIYKFGNNFRRESIKYANLLSNGQGHSDYAFRWRKPGDEAFTNVPSFLYPANSNRDVVYTFSDALIEPAGFLRLQYIDLSYEWKNIGTALPFKLVKIYCNAANLGLVYRANKYNIDPEYQGFNLPPGRTLAFGINASF